jgi:hypothetical protein
MMRKPVNGNLARFSATDVGYLTTPPSVQSAGLFFVKEQPAMSRMINDWPEKTLEPAWITIGNLTVYTWSPGIDC